MLFDPKWNAPDFSLASLIRWLETKPANGTYNFDCCEGGCLIGIYAGENKLNWNDCHTALFQRDELRVAHRKPWTFGAALRRARAIARK